MNILKKAKTFLTRRSSIGLKLRNRNLVFLPNLRVASTAITRSIEKYKEGFEEMFMRPKHINSCEFFMVCRNPYTKIESNYKHCVKTKAWKMYKVQEDCTFEEFVRTQIRLGEKYRDGHTKLQSRLLRFNPTVLRFENLKQDLLEYLNLPLVEITKQRTNSEPLVWSDELKDYFYLAYYDDFINFGYEK